MNCRIKNTDCQVPSATTHYALRITHHASRPKPPSARTAFSLLEVMIACGIFFLAVFAILAMISGVLRNARSLRRVELDAGMVAAQVAVTNKLYEGTASGDFGNIYRDYSWETETFEVGTNSLWQVDIVVRRRDLQKPVDVMSIWLYRPESPPSRR
jgi:hypothetical protein